MATVFLSIAPAEDFDSRAVDEGEKKISAQKG
jgi:hypothetical protein